MLFSPLFTLAPLHSLFYILCAFSLGIITKCYALDMNLYCALLLCLLPLLLYSAINKTIHIWLCIISFSFFIGIIRLENQIKQHNQLYAIFDSSPCSIVGNIASICNLEGGRSQQMIVIDVHTIIQNNVQISVNETIQLYTQRRVTFDVQDTVQIDDIQIKKPKNLDFDAYLVKENISATLFIPHCTYTLLNHPTSSCARWFFHAKQSLFNQCREKLSNQTFALFSSVFLGNRIAGKKEMEAPKESCKTWGISHYLARSGLHLVIFIFIWNLILSLMPISFYLKQSCMLLLCILYFILSWSSVSFVRAFVTFIFYKICILLDIPINVFYLLTLVCFLVLFFNPMQLFFLDFQLSFGLTFALAWYNQVQTQKKFIF
jgi:ComEC/Rec2-related protein